MVKIIIGLVLILSLGFLVFRFTPLFKKTTEEVTIVYWDFWDENLIRPVLAEFEKSHPKVKITYFSQSKLNYRTRLSTQLKGGSGPDVFPIHNSWLPMFLADISPAPSGTVSTSDIKTNFYPVAYDSFVFSNQVYGVPLGIDGLALFVNTDILSAANVSAPKSWNEFMAGAIKMTVKDSSGSIKTSGAALGTATNIDYWSDILSLMLLQQRIDLKNPSSEEGAEVLSFYIGFVTDPTKKVWDVNLPKASEMFIKGNLAFYFAPYNSISEIKAANPNLKFKVIPVPQLPGGNVAFGSFWGETVSSQAKFKNESWELVKFLTSKEVSKVFAIPNGRVDLADTQSGDENFGAFVTQGPIYKFWYLSQTGSDGGINDEMIKIWQTGITGILQGQSTDGVMATINRDTKTILTKYGVK